MNGTQRNCQADGKHENGFFFFFLSGGGGGGWRNMKLKLLWSLCKKEEVFETYDNLNV